MKIEYGRGFWKKYCKLPPKIQEKFDERFRLFAKDPLSPLLRVHTLKGPLHGRRAFSVTGDYRVIYKMTSIDSIKLIDIGKHGQIYS